MTGFSSTLRKLKTIAIGAIAALALSPVAAHALVTPISGAIDNRGTGTSGIGFDGTDTFAASWSGVRGAGNGTFIYQTFSTTKMFSLVLTDYFADRVDTTTVNLYTGTVAAGNPASVLTADVDASDIGVLGGLFAAGTYTFRIAETGRQDVGLASLQVAEIPLPAGLALMLTGLGGLVMVRRRRASAS